MLKTWKSSSLTNSRIYPLDKIFKFVKFSRYDSGANCSWCIRTYAEVDPNVLISARWVSMRSIHPHLSLIGCRLKSFFTAEKMRCHICSDVKKSYMSYVNHKQTHFNQFTCDICQKIFTVYKSLERHILEVHAAKLKFPWNQCNQRLVRYFNKKVFKNLNFCFFKASNIESIWKFTWK